MRVFITIIFFIATSISASAQVKKATAAPKPGKDWLLWYQGKKQNDSMLLTNDGWKILYKRSQNKVEIKTGTQTDKFQKIAAELALSKSRKIEMIRRIAGDKPDPSDLPTIRLVIAAVDDIDSQYRSALKSSVDLPALNLLEKESGENKYSKGPSLDINNPEKTWQEMYADINADIKSLPDPDAIQFGVPPDFDVSICFMCDSIADQRRRQKAENYLLTLKKDEQRIAQNIFILFRVFDKMRDEKGTDLNDELKPVYEELRNHLALIHERVVKKLQRLVKTYQHDFLKIVNLIPLVLGIDRQFQILGCGNELPNELMLENLMIAEDVDNYIKKIIAEEDYARVLNISWILSTDRQFQLLGKESILQHGEFQKVLNFNRFKVTVSADAKEESDQHFKKAQAKSEPTYYKAIPTRDCRFAFVQSNGNKSMGVGKPFLNFELLQAESSQGTYVGTKKWVMIDPYIKFGFCGDDDTVRLFVIMPNLQEPYESWKTDIGIESLPEVTGLFSDAFENNNNMVDESDDMLEQLQYTQKFAESLSSPEQIVSNPLALGNGYFVVEAIKEKFALNALTLVPVTAKNKSTVLFDQLYNGKLTSANENIVYANLWIKLEHVKD